MMAEYDGSGQLLRRYVHGASPTADDPLVWYEGDVMNSTTRRYLHADPRGSIVAVTDGGGTAIATNTYDEFGIPGEDNEGRFQFTGQVWIPEIGMYYYKARMYSPTLGRFMQTDPIGYGDGLNIYSYVGGDPINFVDPTGLFETDVGSECKVTGYDHRFLIADENDDGKYTLGEDILAEYFLPQLSCSDTGQAGFSNQIVVTGTAAGSGISQISTDPCAVQSTEGGAINRLFSVTAGALKGKPVPFFEYLAYKFGIHSSPFSGSFLNKSYWKSDVDVSEVGAFVLRGAQIGGVPSRRNLKVVFDAGRNVGFNSQTAFGQTRFVTVIFGPEGPINPNNGLPTRPFISVYPGC